MRKSDTSLGVKKMPRIDEALRRLDLFLCTYPVRIIKSAVLDGVTADYYCPLAGVAILLTQNARDDARKPHLTKQGLTVLTLKTTIIARNTDEVCAFIDENLRHALVTQK